MDDLDDEIREKQKQREEIRRQLESLDQEIRLLSRAASLRPARARRPAEPPVGFVGFLPAKKRLGKPAGAISMPWRAVLRGIYATDRKVSVEDLLERAQSARIQTKIANVSARARDFVARGYLEGSISDGFVVTEKAASRFGFVKKNEPPADSPYDPG
jgi:hypothetical protein